MTERHHTANSARSHRSASPRALRRNWLLAACATGSLIAMQACGSDNGGTPGSGGSPGANAGNAGANNPGSAGNAGANNPSSAGNAGANNTITAGNSGASNPGGAGADNPGSSGNAGTPGMPGGGAAGAAGTTAGAGAGAGGAAPTDGSVLERNNHASRDGLFIQPTLTKAAIPMLTTDSAFAATFTGNMWASPLFFANGPGGKGLFFAVTTGNDVFAIDETTGKTIWTKKLGSAPTGNGVNCGNIHPLGILSTPVIDAATRTIYIANAIGTTAIDHHEVHALNIDDGVEKAGWPVSMAGLTSGAVTFKAPPQNQRSALSLVNGKLFVAYGGHVGDCGDYHGWVVAIDTANPTSKAGWATLGTGEAIWCAGGMASDGTSIFAVTGNSTVGAGSRAESDSEQVVRLTGMAALTRSDANLFYPTTWKQMDSSDADFGSSNPVYLTIPGSTPPNLIAAVAKDGKLYLLNAQNLGGMGNAVATLTVATGGAMNVKTSPTAYTNAKGTHFVMSTDGGAACPGGAGGKSIISMLIKAGSPPTATAEWCAPLTGTVTAPISTMTNGTDNAAVWYMNSGKLTAVDGDTGTKLYESADTCAGVRQWTSPIAVKGRIVVGGDNHLCSWSAK